MPCKVVYVLTTRRKKIRNEYNSFYMILAIVTYVGAWRKRNKERGCFEDVAQGGRYRIQISVVALLVHYCNLHTLYLVSSVNNLASLLFNFM